MSALKAARTLLGRATSARETQSWNSAAAYAAAAQAEATLALAEQQRVASLIEYLRTAATNSTDHSPEAVAWMEDIAVEIREGLGI